MKVRLFCLDPSHLLRQALTRGRATIFFSATLTPRDYYRTLLGGSPKDPVVHLASPFPPENLAALVTIGSRPTLTDGTNHSETGPGVVLLIDARFNETRYRRLFPAWWKFVRVRHSSGLEEAVNNFWKRRS